MKPSLNGLVENEVNPEKASVVSFGKEYCGRPAARAGREMGKPIKHEIKETLESGFAPSGSHRVNYVNLLVF
jgi:hypothetical protein